MMMVVLNARLQALTLEAQSALHQKSLEIFTFPFRVGRENRGPNAGWARHTGPERRSEETPPNNELYLWESEQNIHVSREHFEIVREGEQFFLVDRGSTLGTWVEGQLVGGNKRGGKAPLESGAVIIVGTHHSGFIFKFICD